MKYLKTLFCLMVVSLVLFGCGGEAEAPPTDVTVPSGPLPAIEIVGGDADTCVNTDETQSTVMGFDVVYYDMGTDAFMFGLMSAPETGPIGSVNTAGEGREGEGRWGLYPQAYDLPPNTPITLEITVYAGKDASAPVSSTSSLTYDCTTGETISASFER